MATQLYTYNTRKPITGTEANGDVNALDVCVYPSIVGSDAFNRLRTSQPRVLFAGTHDLSDAAYLFDTLTVGGGAATHVTAESAYKLEVGTASGDRAVRQSYAYIPYTPGNSHTAMFTGVLGAGSSASSQRIGLFDDNNGVFFELKNQAFGVVNRSKVTGSVVDQRIEQADFNLDKLDGTGPSKLNIDTTKAQIFHISYEWLGVGSVIFSVVIGGNIIPCHIDHHSNLINTVYMQSGSLPVRYEVVNTGATTATDDFRMICAMVMSEGDAVEGGPLRSVSNGITVVNVGTTFEPVLSLRVDPNNPRILLRILDMDIFPTGKLNTEWAVFLNGTLTGASWTDAPSGYAEYDVTASAISGGERLLGGYATDVHGAQINADKITRRLAADIGGTPDIFTIAARSFSATNNIVASINYKELL